MRLLDESRMASVQGWRTGRFPATYARSCLGNICSLPPLSLPSLPPLFFPLPSSHFFPSSPSPLFVSFPRPYYLSLPSLTPPHPVFSLLPSSSISLLPLPSFLSFPFVFSFPFPTSQFLSPFLFLIPPFPLPLLLHYYLLVLL